MLDQTIILQLFDEWLEQASEEQIKENCRTEGSLFFKFMAARGVDGRICYRIIKDATGYNPRWIWRDAPLAVIREALENYVYSQQGILAHENEKGRTATPKESIGIAKFFWRR